jgi:hypothetical protein
MRCWRRGKHGFRSNGRLSSGSSRWLSCWSGNWRSGRLIGGLDIRLSRWNIGRLL